MARSGKNLSTFEFERRNIVVVFLFSVQCKADPKKKMILSVFSVALLNWEEEQHSYCARRVL